MLIKTLPVLALLALTIPAVAQERQWALDTSDQDAYLIFGVPESDDVGLSIWCTIYSGKSKIFVPKVSGYLKPGGHATMRLTAGEVSVRVQGLVTDNQDAGTRSLEAELPTSSPLYAALQTADRLRITIAGVEQVYPLADADVAGLLKLCNAP
jgi:hypothetical protein